MAARHLGNRIRVVREQRTGASLREAEVATGIHYTYLGRLERDEDGALAATGAKIVTLARYLGVTTDYLLGMAEGSNELILRQRMAQATPAEREQFQRRMTEGQRLGKVLDWLEAAGVSQVTPEDLARQIDFPIEELLVIIAGKAEMSDFLADKATIALGLPRRLLEYGDLGPSPELIARVVNHPDSEEYLRSLAEAMDAGVSPRSLNYLVKTLVAQQESPR